MERIVYWMAGAVLFCWIKRVVETDIIFLDESSPLLHRKDAATILKNSKNYFTIISRDVTLGFKSVSLNCVYKMKTSGQYHTFDKAYVIPHNVFKVNNIVCEDSRRRAKGRRRLHSFCSSDR